MSEQPSRRTVLQTIAAGLATGGLITGTATAHVAGGAGNRTRELAAVRSATARYHSTTQAENHGYVREEPPVCGMGYHWPNPGKLDGSVSKTDPEVLVYGVRNGNLTLGAVEYLIPKALSPAPPDPFEYFDPEWHTLELPPEAPVPFTELWSLHAWVHEHNPEGVFHPTNPRPLFHPPGCVDEERGGEDPGHGESA